MPYEDHKVLFQLRNPFKKRAPFAATPPMFVFITRGRGLTGGTAYTVHLYGLRGDVKAIYRLDVMR
jgi:hypothetical protein